MYHKDNSDVGEDFLPPVDSGKEVVLVYAMRRITCPELTKVNLRTLGLTGGKCMLRYTDGGRYSNDNYEKLIYITFSEFPLILCQSCDAMHNIFNKYTLLHFS